MTEKPEYRVATAGLEAREVRLIGIIFRHSRYNRHAFSLIGEDEVASADILIADPRSPAGLQAVARARSRARGSSVVLVVPETASTSVASASRHILSIERLTLQLLPVLNRVVETALLDPQAADLPRADSVAPEAARPAGTAAMRPDRPRQTAAPETADAPRVAAPMPATEPVPSNLVAFPRVAESPPPPRVRVLIVDDSPTVRHQLMVALSRTGLLCDTAASAEEALERLSREHYDLALVDVVMPGVDGYKLTRQMRRRHRGLPVIILTSRSSPFDLARGALAGCDSYLVKPVPLRQLEAAVVKQLRRTLAIADFDRLAQMMARPAGNPPVTAQQASGVQPPSWGASADSGAGGRAG